MTFPIMYNDRQKKTSRHLNVSVKKSINYLSQRQISHLHHTDFLIFEQRLGDFCKKF
jgi:hypothetical protein